MVRIHFPPAGSPVRTSFSRANRSSRRRLGPPGDTPYGLHEFGHVDPEGNLLRVGDLKQRAVLKPHKPQRWWTPMSLTDHPALAGMLEAAEQRGRVQLLAELAQMLGERIRWPGADLFIEMLSGLVDREPDPGG